MNEKSQDKIFTTNMIDTNYQVPNNFLTKVKKIVRLAGKGISEKVLLLYSVFKDEKVSAQTKLTIASALSYFILPFDAIPDFLVGIGFTDDLSVLMGVIYLISSTITQEHKDNATRLTGKLFD